MSLGLQRQQSAGYFFLAEFPREDSKYPDFNCCKGFFVILLAVDFKFFWKYFTVNETGSNNWWWAQINGDWAPTFCDLLLIFWHDICFWLRMQLANSAISAWELTDWKGPNLNGVLCVNAFKRSWNGSFPFVPPRLTTQLSMVAYYVHPTDARAIFLRSDLLFGTCSLTRGAWPNGGTDGTDWGHRRYWESIIVVLILRSEEA